MIITVITVTAASMGFTAAISMATVVILIAFLASKELARASHSGAFLRVAKFANVALLPLVMAFAVIVAVNIASILLA